MRFFMPLQMIFSLETFVTNLTCEILDIVGGLSVRAYRALRKRWKITLRTLPPYPHQNLKKENRLYNSKFWSLAKSRSKFFVSIWFMDMVVFSLLNTSLLDRDSKTAFETMGISGELSLWNFRLMKNHMWYVDDIMIPYLRNRKNPPIQT